MKQSNPHLAFSKAEFETTETFQWLLSMLNQQNTALKGQEKAKQHS